MGEGTAFKSPAIEGLQVAPGAQRALSLAQLGQHSLGIVDAEGPPRDLARDLHNGDVHLFRPGDLLGDAGADAAVRKRPGCSASRSSTWSRNEEAHLVDQNWQVETMEAAAHQE